MSWAQDATVFMALNMCLGRFFILKHRLRCFSWLVHYSPYGSFDNAYITWINNGTKVWTIMSAGMGADTQTEVCTILSSSIIKLTPTPQIGARAVPQEPMVCSSFSQIFMNGHWRIRPILANSTSLQILAFHKISVLSTLSIWYFQRRCRWITYVCTNLRTPTILAVTP